MVIFVLAIPDRGIASKIANSILPFLYISQEHHPYRGIDHHDNNGIGCDQKDCC